MSKRALEAALKAYPHNDGRVWAGVFGVIKYDQYSQERKGFQRGYEQAEKDIWGRIEKYLSEQDSRNYATAGFILKNFDYFKQQIMEEE